MERYIKKAAVVLALISVSTVTFADRGSGKRISRARTTLNIGTNTSLKTSIMSNLKTGLVYKGTLFAKKPVAGGNFSNSSLMTYQKGNTTYIIPYKSRMTVPEIKQGYAGVKLILRSNK